MQSLAAHNPDFLQKIIGKLPCDPIETLGKPSKDDIYLKRFASGVNRSNYIERQCAPILHALIKEKNWQDSIVAEAFVWQDMFRRAGLNLVWSEVSEIDGNRTEEAHDSGPIADEANRQSRMKVQLYTYTLVA